MRAASNAQRPTGASHREAGHGVSAGPATDLVCAIVERAVEDVRHLRRQGLINPDGSVVKHEEGSRRAKARFLVTPVACGSRGKTGDQVGRDAVLFFADGRLERLCDLINSPMIHADRIRAKVFGAELNLQKPGYRLL